MNNLVIITVSQMTRPAFVSQLNLIFICCLVWPLPSTDARQNNIRAKAMTAPNYGVRLNVTMFIEDVSEIRPQEMEFDLDVRLVLEGKFMDNRTCENYLQLLPSAFEVNTPKPNQRAFVPSNVPQGNDENENYWFPNIYFKEATKVSYTSALTPTFSTSYKNTAPSNDSQSLSFCGPRYIIKRRLTIACPLDFGNYPLDVHECNLTIAGFTYPAQYVQMHWNLSAVDSLITNPKIRLSEYFLKIRNSTYEPIIMNRNEIAGLTVQLIFARNITYRLICFVVPSALLVITSWGVYLMPPEMATERLTLSSNSLFALFSMISSSRSSIPPAKYLNYADIWMIACLAYVLLVTMESCMVEQISGSEADFEERRKRKEMELRNKDDLFRCWQRFRETTRLPIRTEPLSPAVVTPKQGFQRPISKIITDCRHKRISRGDLDQAIKGLIGYIDHATPWYLLPWPAKIVDLWAQRVLTGCFIVFTIIFWGNIIRIKLST